MTGPPTPQCIIAIKAASINFNFLLLWPLKFGNVVNLKVNFLKEIWLFWSYV